MTITKARINSISPNDFCVLVSRDDDFRLEIYEKMKTFGGSFVQALGECLMRADRENRYKLAETFTEYFIKYATWGRK